MAAEMPNTAYITLHIMSAYKKSLKEEKTLRNAFRISSDAFMNSVIFYFVSKIIFIIKSTFFQLILIKKILDFQILYLCAKINL